MRIGYQKGSLIFRSKKKTIAVSRLEILCVAAGLILFLLLELQSRNDPLKAGYIARGAYGQGEEKLDLVVEGLDGQEKGLALDLTVGERRYTKEQASAAAEELENRLESMILGEEPSLSQVRTKLELVKQDDQTGFRIRWSSDHMDLLGTDGVVHGETVGEEGQVVNLRAEIYDGKENLRSVLLPVRILPPQLTPQERQREDLTQLILSREEQTRTEEGFYLPTEYEGGPITYRSRDGGERYWLLLLGPVLAVLIRARGIDAAKQMGKERERRLLLDHAEMLSKLQIFLGAGMTVRTAWERIVLDYQEMKSRGKGERPVYEEMLMTYHQMRSGTAEGKAYEEFGRRCKLQPYLKLAGLLEQNRKTGTKNLRYLLQIEMTDAFEQRKNLARRQGEEAATKLLIPLFLMLGVVMVIVVVPAFLTFY